MGLLLAAVLSFFIFESTTDAVSASETIRLLTTYTTSSTRSQSVTDFCADLSRSELVDSSQESSYKFYSEQMDKLLPVDGYLLPHIETS